MALTVYSHIVGRNVCFDDPNPNFNSIMAMYVERGNKRFKEHHEDFELLQLVRTSCLNAGLKIREREDKNQILDGYCGFMIQTASGEISVIVNECHKIELLPYFNHGESRMFTGGGNPYEDGMHYNPWFTKDEDWLTEIKRVADIMNKPKQKITKTQRRRFRRIAQKNAAKRYL